MDIGSIIGVVLGSGAVGGLLGYLVGKVANPAAKAAWSEEAALASKVHSPVIQSGFTYLMRIALKELAQEEPALVASLAKLHVPAAVTTGFVDAFLKDAPAQYQPATVTAPPPAAASTVTPAPSVPIINVVGETGPAGVLPIVEGGGTGF